MFCDTTENITTLAKRNLEWLFSFKIVNIFCFFEPTVQHKLNKKMYSEMFLAPGIIFFLSKRNIFSQYTIFIPTVNVKIYFCLAVL